MLQEYSHSHGLGSSHWNKQDFPSKTTSRWQQTTPKHIDAILQGCSCSLCLKAWAPPTFTVSAFSLILFSRWRNPMFACYIEKGSVHAVYSQITELIFSSGIITLIITTFQPLAAPEPISFFSSPKCWTTKASEQNRQPSRRSPLQGRSCVLHRGYAKTYTAWIPQKGSGDKVVFSLVYRDLSSFSLNLLMMLCRAKKSPNCW